MYFERSSAKNYYLSSSREYPFYYSPGIYLASVPSLYKGNGFYDESEQYIKMPIRPSISWLNRPLGEECETLKLAAVTLKSKFSMSATVMEFVAEYVCRQVQNCTF